MLSSFYCASLAGSALLSNSLPPPTFLSAAVNSSGLISHWCNCRGSVSSAMVFSSHPSPVTNTFYFRQQQQPQQTELEVVPGRESLAGYDHAQVNAGGFACPPCCSDHPLLLGLQKQLAEFELRLGLGRKVFSAPPCPVGSPGRAALMGAVRDPGSSMARCLRGCPALCCCAQCLHSSLLPGSCAARECCWPGAQQTSGEGREPL